MAKRRDCYNDPLNKADPLGLRPDDSQFNIDLGGIVDAVHDAVCSARRRGLGTSTEVHDAGFFERDRAKQLLARRPYIEASAHAVGIDSFLLAVLIYHEGGRYLDPWTRGGAQDLDYAKLAKKKNPSLGIAKVKIPSAIRVLHDVYCLDVDAGLGLASLMIQSEQFDIALAAGYLAELKTDYQLTDNRVLFLAYAASPEAIRVLRPDFNLDLIAAANSNGDRVSQETINILKARDRDWTDAGNDIRAVGW